MNLRQDNAPQSERFFRIRVIGLVALATVMAAYTLYLPPRPQWQSYHNFADRRGILGVANFFDVASNAPFALVGAVGLWFLAGDAAAARRGRRSRLDWQDRWTFGVMFAGVLLTAFGSGYYHLAPDNATLFWDRLPMTVAFMGLLAGMIAERISRKAGACLLVPLVLFGMATVAYWRWTEGRGAGDLRFYMWLAQGFPLIALPYLAGVFGPRYLPRSSVFIALGWYVLAKCLEVFDAQIYAAGGIVSGHTLKHLAAAIGTYWILRAIVRNSQRPEGPNSEGTRYGTRDSHLSAVQG
ncbi:MAG: hypothetical protein ACYS5V_11610 [Planctomycetota bacterium]|jgi:hypothetical protein